MNRRILADVLSFVFIVTIVVIFTNLFLDAL